MDDDVAALEAMAMDNGGEDEALEPDEGNGEDDAPRTGGKKENEPALPDGDAGANTRPSAARYNANTNDKHEVDKHVVGSARTKSSSDNLLALNDASRV